MKQTWDKLYNHLFDLKEALLPLLGDLPQSKTFTSHKRRITACMNSISHQTKELNKFMNPVDPVDVKPIFNHEAFLDAWQCWKDYLIEQHGLYMKSRMERAALERVFSMANKDPELAIRFINNSMSGGYKQIYAIENQTQEPKKTKGYDPDFANQ